MAVRFVFARSEGRENKIKSSKTGISPEGKSAAVFKRRATEEKFF